MIDDISSFLQPSVAFFKLLHDDPFRVYLTAALWVGIIQWSSKEAWRILRWLVNKGADSILNGK